MQHASQAIGGRISCSSGVWQHAVTRSLILMTDWTTKLRSVNKGASKHCSYHQGFAKWQPVRIGYKPAMLTEAMLISYDSATDLVAVGYWTNDTQLVV